MSTSIDTSEIVWFIVMPSGESEESLSFPFRLVIGVVLSTGLHCRPPSVESGDEFVVRSCPRRLAFALSIFCVFTIASSSTFADTSFMYRRSTFVSTPRAKDSRGTCLSPAADVRRRSGLLSRSRIEEEACEDEDAEFLGAFEPGDGDHP